MDSETRDRLRDMLVAYRNSIVYYVIGHSKQSIVDAPIKMDELMGQLQRLIDAYGDERYQSGYWDGQDSERSYQSWIAENP